MLKPAEWVDQCGDYLYRYAVSPLRNGDASEEVVQEMFVAAPRHVDQYEAKGSARAWLLGIFKRKNIDLIRARNRTTSLDDEFVPRQFRLVLQVSIAWRATSRRELVPRLPCAMVAM